MAVNYAISDDIKNNCSKIEGNEAGRYEVDEAIIDYGGASHHIEVYLREIHIYEDIDKFGVTGHLVLLDSDNLISGYISTHAIVGQELLYLKFRTLGSNFPVDFTEHPLQIHKIENLQEMETETDAKSGLTYTYRLHFCSPEMIMNDRIRISQTYEDTYSNIVKAILKDHLKTQKRIWLQLSTGLRRVVIPNMHPFDAINMIVKDSEELSLPDFNFYETTKGFAYKTLLGNPGRQTDDRQVDITFGPTIQDGNYQREMRTALGYSFIRIGDTFETVKGGMWGSKHIEHDSFNKIYKTHTVGYHDDLPLNVYNPDYKHFVTKGSIYDPGTIPTWRGKSISEFPDARLFVSSTNTKRRFDYVNADGGVPPRDDEEATDSLKVPEPKQRMLRVLQKGHDEYVKLGLTINGISGLQVGDKIHLKTMTLGAPSAQGRGKIDGRFQDYYYITQLSHNINLRSDVAKYTCNIICVQQSLLIDKLPALGALTKSEKAGPVRSFFATEERNIG